MADGRQHDSGGSSGGGVRVTASFAGSRTMIGSGTVTLVPPVRIAYQMWGRLGEPGPGTPQITRLHQPGGTASVPGTVTCGRMGPNNVRTEACATCGHSFECPGHAGYIRAPLPVILLFAPVRLLLSCTCVFCCRVMLPPPGGVADYQQAQLVLKVRERLRATLRPSSSGGRADAMEKLLELDSTSRFRRRAAFRTCPHCSLPQPSWQFAVRNMIILWRWEPEDMRALPPPARELAALAPNTSLIDAILSRIPRDDLALLGLGGALPGGLRAGPAWLRYLRACSARMAADPQAALRDPLLLRGAGALPAAEWPLAPPSDGEPGSDGGMHGLLSSALRVLGNPQRPPIMTSGGLKPSPDTLAYGELMRRIREAWALAEAEGGGGKERGGAAAQRLAALAHAPRTGHLSAVDLHLALRRGPEAAATMAAVMRGANQLLHDNSRHWPAATDRSRVQREAMLSRLARKRGVIRQFMAGKRINGSGRAVITGGPNLNADQVGVPAVTMATFTVPTKVRPWNAAWLRAAVVAGPNTVGGALAVELGREGEIVFLDELTEAARAALPLRYCDTVLRHLREGDLVVINRQPTLHRMAMLALRATPVEGDTLKLPLLVLWIMNGDFDGDEVNILMPPCHWEALVLCYLGRHVRSPARNGVCVGLIQDGTTGINLLTRSGVLLPPATLARLAAVVRGPWTPQPPAQLWPSALFAGRQAVSSLLAHTRAHVSDGMHQAAGPATLWADDQRHLLVSRGLLLLGALRKSHVAVDGSLLNCLSLYPPPPATLPPTPGWAPLRPSPALTVLTFLTDLQRLAHAANELRALSIGWSAYTLDGVASAAVAREVRRTLSEVNALDGVGRKARLPKLDIHEAVSRALTQGNTNVTKVTMAALRREDDAWGIQALLRMVQSGGKGTPTNVKQMLSALMQQMYDDQRMVGSGGGRNSAVFAHSDTSAQAQGFVTKSFAQGLAPHDEVVHTRCARPDMVAKASEVSLVGYQLLMWMHSMLPARATPCGAVVNGDTLVQLWYGGDGWAGEALVPVRWRHMLRASDAERAALFGGCRELAEAQAVRLAELRAGLCGALNPSPPDVVRLPLHPHRLFHIEVPLAERHAPPPAAAALADLHQELEALGRWGAGRAAPGALTRLLYVLGWEGARLLRSEVPSRAALRHYMACVRCAVEEARVPAGEAVGVVAAGSIAQKTQQSGMNAFHLPGQASVPTVAMYSQLTCFSRYAPATMQLAPAPHVALTPAHARSLLAVPLKPLLHQVTVDTAPLADPEAEAAEAAAAAGGAFTEDAEWLAAAVGLLGGNDCPEAAAAGAGWVPVDQVLRVVVDTEAAARAKLRLPAVVRALVGQLRSKGVTAALTAAATAGRLLSASAAPPPASAPAGGDRRAVKGRKPRTLQLHWTVRTTPAEATPDGRWVVRLRPWVAGGSAAAGHLAAVTAYDGALEEGCPAAAAMVAGLTAYLGVCGGPPPGMELAAEDAAALAEEGPGAAISPAAAFGAADTAADGGRAVLGLPTWTSVSELLLTRTAAGPGVAAIFRKTLLSTAEAWVAAADGSWGPVEAAVVKTGVAPGAATQPKRAGMAVAARYAWIDWHTSVTTSVPEVMDTLGLAAAASCLQEHMDELAQGVDVRHGRLLAAHMASDGTLLGYNRHSLTRRSGPSAAERITFEMQVNHILKATKLGTRDGGWGVQEHLLRGELPPLGTGCTAIVPGNVVPPAAVLAAPIPRRLAPHGLTLEHVLAAQSAAVAVKETALLDCSSGGSGGGSSSSGGGGGGGGANSADGAGTGEPAWDGAWTAAAAGLPPRMGNTWQWVGLHAIAASVAAAGVADTASSSDGWRPAWSQCLSHAQLELLDRHQGRVPAGAAMGRPASRLPPLPRARLQGRVALKPWLAQGVLAAATDAAAAAAALPSIASAVRAGLLEPLPPAAPGRRAAQLTWAAAQRALQGALRVGERVPLGDLPLGAPKLDDGGELLAQHLPRQQYVAAEAFVEGLRCALHVAVLPDPAAPPGTPDSAVFWGAAQHVALRAAADGADGGAASGSPPDAGAAQQAALATVAPAWRVVPLLHLLDPPYRGAAFLLPRVALPPVAAAGTCLMGTWTAAGPQHALLLHDAALVWGRPLFSLRWASRAFAAATAAAPVVPPDPDTAARWAGAAPFALCSTHPALRIGAARWIPLTTTALTAAAVPWRALPPPALGVPPPPTTPMVLDAPEGVWRAGLLALPTGPLPLQRGDVATAVLRVKTHGGGAAGTGAAAAAMAAGGRPGTATLPFPTRPPVLWSPWLKTTLGLRLAVAGGPPPRAATVQLRYTLDGTEQDLTWDAPATAAGALWILHAPVPVRLGLTSALAGWVRGMVGRLADEGGGTWEARAQVALLLDVGDAAGQDVADFAGAPAEWAAWAWATPPLTGPPAGQKLAAVGGGDGGGGEGEAASDVGSEAPATPAAAHARLDAAWKRVPGVLLHAQVLGPAPATTQPADAAALLQGLLGRGADVATLAAVVAAAETSGRATAPLPVLPPAARGAVVPAAAAAAAATDAVGTAALSAAAAAALGPAGAGAAARRPPPPVGTDTLARQERSNPVPDAAHGRVAAALTAAALAT